MKALIATLESANGSRELDYDIAQAVGTIRQVPHEREWDSHSTEWPEYTTSLDKALTLIPEGWFLDHLGDTMGGAHCDLAKKDGSWTFGAAETRALAVCIAALRARVEGEKI